MSGDLYFLPAGSSLPTAADLAKLTPSSLITGFTGLTLEAPMPEKIDWSRITKHMPRKWRAVARPFPIEGGALFIVAQPTRLGIFHAILRYHSEADKIDTYLAPGFGDTSGSVFRTASDARAMALKYAAHENTPLDPKPWKTAKNRRYEFQSDAGKTDGLDWLAEFRPRPGYRQDESDYS